jgi:hypothetical protein
MTQRNSEKSFAQMATPRFASSGNAPEPAFAQILGKQNYFKLFENLRLILVDYAQKPIE